MSGVAETTELELAYQALNRSYGDPLVLHLTRRGFFSEVTVLVTVMVFCLVHKRRLIVDQTHFNGLQWSDFFQTSLPGGLGAEDADTPQPDIVIHDIASPVMSHIRGWIATVARDERTLDVPDLGLAGTAFDVKRALSLAFCIPRRTIRRDAERTMTRMGLAAGKFAALHVRRGDKITGLRGATPEGEATTPRDYFAALGRYAPGIADVFVLTDDARFLGLLRATGAGVRLHSLCPMNETGHDEIDFNARPVGQKREEINRLLTEVEIATVSSPFLGGFKSNVSRHATTVHAWPEVCHSVDKMTKWVPF